MMMLNNRTINNSHECLKVNIQKIIKKFLYVNLIAIITLFLSIIFLCLLIWIFTSLSDENINANKRAYWLIIFTTLLMIVFIWLFFRVFAFGYGYQKIKRFNWAGDYKLAQINWWIKLVIMSLNHYYLYEILIIDIFLEKFHKGLNRLSGQQKQRLFRNTFLINIGMLCIYLAWLSLLFTLGASFNLFDDKYFWLLTSLFVGFFSVKIILRIIFIYYLIIFKRSSLFNNQQFLKLINITQKSRNDYFVFKLYVNFLM